MLATEHLDYIACSSQARKHLQEAQHLTITLMFQHMWHTSKKNGATDKATGVRSWLL